MTRAPCRLGEEVPRGAPLMGAKVHQLAASWRPAAQATQAAVGTSSTSGAGWAPARNNKGRMGARGGVSGARGMFSSPLKGASMGARRDWS
eukprot:274594-Prorocentrum_minimum.AAC.1